MWLWEGVRRCGCVCGCGKVCVGVVVYVVAFPFYL
jgi:hypothetical protein